MELGRQSAYSILNVHKGASDEEIKRSFIRLVKKYDPELHTEQFMRIKAAYETLKDQKKRATEDVFTFDFIKGRFIFTPEEKAETTETEIIKKLKDLEKAYKEKPEQEQTKKALADAYMKHSWLKFRKKLWIEAIHDWNNVLHLEATHLRARQNLLNAYITLGYSYATHGLYQEAIELWEKALKMNPDNSAVVHNLALAYELSGQKDKAMDFWAETVKRWKAALDKDPDNEYVKNSIIEVHRHHGGEAIIRKKDKEAAIQEYREVLKINPDDFDAYYQIATTLMEEQKWDEAIQELQQLARRHPRNVEVLNLLGCALLNSGQVDAAFNTWRRSLILDPKNVQTRDNVIRAHLNLGKKLRESGLYTPALVHFKALLKYMPRSPEVHFEIASTYMMRGDYDSAYREFNVVLELDPKNKPARKALSEIRLRR